MKGSARKFFELDPTESLAENLSGKCIVEFPIVFVVLKDHAYNFEIITPGNCNFNNLNLNDYLLALDGIYRPASVVPICISSDAIIC